MARVLPFSLAQPLLDKRERRKMIGFSVITAMLVAGVMVYQQCHNWRITRIVQRISDNMKHLDQQCKQIQENIETPEQQTSKSQANDMATYVDDLMNKQMMPKDLSNDTLVDYALGAAGARIISTGITESYIDKKSNCNFLGYPLCIGSSDVQVVLQESSKPGDCWAVKGQEASLIIQLAASTFVDSVLLDHIHYKHAPLGDTSSAPNKFSIWGVESETSDQKHLFGIFHYNNKGTSVQTFKVQYPGLRPFKLIEFQLHSNHGNPQYTCIYKIRIHGKDESHTK